MLRSSLLLSLVFGFALSEGGYSQWSPETYPNSMRDLQLCGLQSPSYVCDPNDLLEDIDGQSGIVLLEKALLELRNSTNCTCSGIDNHVCGMTPHGFTVSIAVVEKMKLPPGREDRTSRTEAILQFADDLRIRLPRGQCDDDLFIVISVNDSAIWTSTGRVTEVILQTDMINSITMTAENHFIKKEYTRGLLYMVNMYTKVLRGERAIITNPNGWYWPIPLWSIILILVVIVTLVFGSIGLCIYCCCNCCKKHDGYTLGQRT